MTGKSWTQWHTAYDDPDSELSRRLVAVRERIRTALDAAKPGPIRVVSMCAGDGRDLLGALDGHSRRRDVRATLVELDPELAARGRAAAAGTGVEVVQGDAALTDLYSAVVPAGLVLACGIFGNITEADMVRTIAALPGFMVPGGTVIWTRHREEPDLVPRINAWFDEHGFELVWVSDKQAGYGVGVHRLIGPARPLRTGERLFTFVS
ncbi:hypothetical protein GCM10023322_81520 [Rugosimonospora acidiphila]|uniref:Methyltransferase domain-containing protein n=1 Tax=Rugosimonospora acidiphila TaxID=556531 RepID=A0ABP9ST14_9ACTN